MLVFLVQSRKNYKIFYKDCLYTWEWNWPIFISIYLNVTTKNSSKIAILIVSHDNFYETLFNIQFNVPVRYRQDHLVPKYSILE